MPDDVTANMPANMPVDNSARYPQHAVTGTVPLQQEPLQQEVQRRTAQPQYRPAAENGISAQNLPPLHIQDVDELKAALIQQLQVEHTMLAAAIGKTLNWYEQDDVLYISVHTPFEVQQLQREKNILTKKTASLRGKDLKVQITLAQENTVQKAPIPARVEMVLRNIKGSIVGIQKKIIEAEPEEE